MKNNQIYQIFTHKDLDGAVSLLTFLWSNPTATTSYREITNIETNEIENYVNKTCNPPKILIMDIAIKENMLHNLDYDFITFIDHHQSTEEYIKKFKQAKVIYKNETSNSILIRKLFKETAPELTESQKKLILLADDHDSGEKKFKESYDLNILFWTYFKNQFCYFCEFYKNGFKPFTENQIKFIKKAKYDAKIKDLETICYQGNLIIEGEVKNVVAATTENYNSIVLDNLMDKYKPDILFYINLKTEKISMRQRKTKNPIKLFNFAKNYCDGNGHMYAAGGKITPIFLEMTKKLKQIC